MNIEPNTINTIDLQQNNDNFDNVNGRVFEIKHLTSDLHELKIDEPILKNKVQESKSIVKENEEAEEFYDARESYHGMPEHLAPIMGVRRLEECSELGEEQIMTIPLQPTVVNSTRMSSVVPGQPTPIRLRRE